MRGERRLVAEIGGEARRGGRQQLRGYRLPQCSGFPKNGYCHAAVCGGRGENKTVRVDVLGGGIVGIQQDLLADEPRLRAEERAPYSSVGLYKALHVAARNAALQKL